MIRVYVSGPITHPDPKENALKGLEMGEKLLHLGYYPFLPHLYVFWNDIYPHDYETWMELDLNWLEQCDAVLRLPGYSLGADREVKHARDRGIPTYFCIEDLVRNFRPKRKENP